MVGSVTKLFLATNQLTKVAQIFCDFLAIFKTTPIKVRTHMATFWEKFDYFLFQDLITVMVPR